MKADIPLTPPGPTLRSVRYIPELTVSYRTGKSGRLIKANLTKVRDAKTRLGKPMRNVTVLFITIFASACTAVTVKPIDTSLNAKHVCIQDNPKVTVSDFVPVVRDGFARHGLSTEIITNNKPARCDLILTYTARRSWDIATYLSVAELVLFQNGLEVARANFHLKGKGGFALNKWRSTKAKMDPVIDELLASYSIVPESERPAVTSYAVISEPTEDISQDAHTTNEAEDSKDIYAHLIKLDELREQGILTDGEFDAEKKKLLERN